MATDRQKSSGPKRSAYFLAAIPLIVGLAVCSLLGVKVVKKIVAGAENFARVIVPGTKTIEFAAPGNYTIFFEHKSVVDGVAYSSSENAISGMRCAVRNVETGADVPVRASVANMSYSLGSREGRAYFEFTIPAAGKYRLDASFPPGRDTGERFVLAISQGFAMALVQDIGLIFTIVGLLIVFTGGSIAAFVLVYLRRERAAKAGLPSS